MNVCENWKLKVFFCSCKEISYLSRGVSAGASTHRTIRSSALLSITIRYIFFRHAFLTCDWQKHILIDNWFYQNHTDFEFLWRTDCSFIWILISLMLLLLLRFHPPTVPLSHSLMSVHYILYLAPILGRRIRCWYINREREREIARARKREKGSIESIWISFGVVTVPYKRSEIVYSVVATTTTKGCCFYHHYHYYSPTPTQLRRKCL